jgi:hypothetical protein
MSKTVRFYIDLTISNQVQEILPEGRYLSSTEIIQTQDLLLSPTDRSTQVPLQCCNKEAGTFLQYNYLFYRPQNSNFSETFNALLKAYKVLNGSKKYHLINEIESFVNDWRGDMNDHEFNQKYGF